MPRDNSALGNQFSGSTSAGCFCRTIIGSVKPVRIETGHLFADVIQTFVKAHDIESWFLIRVDHAPKATCFSEGLKLGLQADHKGWTNE